MLFNTFWLILPGISGNILSNRFWLLILPVSSGSILLNTFWLILPGISGNILSNRFWLMLPVSSGNILHSNVSFAWQRLICFHWSFSSWLRLSDTPII
ncbi:hypothetical protein BSKO_04928 [Bryopsis sp. KO-2023]|nr:hypothetical protein BSKO_04928 [Bryopsis sp. KO-2023]